MEIEYLLIVYSCSLDEHWILNQDAFWILRERIGHVLHSRLNKDSLYLHQMHKNTPIQCLNDANVEIKSIQSDASLFKLN